MAVHVGIETQGPPTRARLDVLRSAAAQCTDNQASIHVTHEPMPDLHSLMTPCTRRTTAQYKVVDELAAGCKRDIWDCAASRDMWRTFPTPTMQPRRRSRKPPSEAADGLSPHAARLWVAVSHTPQQRTVPSSHAGVCRANRAVYPVGPLQGNPLGLGPIPCPTTHWSRPRQW